MLPRPYYNDPVREPIKTFLIYYVLFLIVWFAGIILIPILFWFMGVAHFIFIVVGLLWVAIKTNALRK